MSEARISVSYRLPKSLVERARRVARDFAGKPDYLTVGTLVQAALESELAKYEGRIDDPGDPLPIRRINAAGSIRKRVINAH